MERPAVTWGCVQAEEQERGEKRKNFLINGVRVGELRRPSNMGAQKGGRNGPRSRSGKGLNWEGSRIRAHNSSPCSWEEGEADPKVTGVGEQPGVVAR